VVKSSLGAAFLRAGDVAGASEEFGAAARLGARSGDLTAAVAALQRHAELLIALGRPGAADQAAREALQLAAAQGSEALPALAPIYLLMGRLAYERNDLDGAAHSLTEALRRYDAGGHGAPAALLALARVRQAEGQVDAAHDLVVQAGDLLGAGPRLRAAGAAAWPDGARVLLARGDVAGARRWAQLGGAGLEGPPDLWRAPEYLTLARVLIAEEQPDAALTVLRPLRQAARAGGCQAVEAEALVVEALAYSKLGDGPAARGALDAALALTAAEGYVRLYADGGRPIVALLRQLRHGDGAQRAYAERLLTILGGDSSAPAAPPAAPKLVEPLTEREQEILHLLAVGYSNQAVAQELFMGVSTVKWHLINIYGKLQVKTRTQAVARAREVGLV
jgi:LuxR family maltose regulon positive regulatory protein